MHLPLLFGLCSPRFYNQRLVNIISRNTQMTFLMSVKIEEMKKRIMDLLDGIDDLKKAPENAIDEVKKLLEEYWSTKETYFSTKMEPWKIHRADLDEWNRLDLWFIIHRHPGGLRRQTWCYDFDEDQAILCSEGSIPQSPYYTAKITRNEAQAIMNALKHDAEHPAVIRRDNLFIINPRKISELTDAPKQTVEGRVKRLKPCIKNLMKKHPEFKETKYRNMLAYRLSCISKNDKVL